MRLLAPHRMGKILPALLALLLLAACQTGDETGGEPGGLAISGTAVLEGAHTYGPEARLPGVLLVLDGQAILEAGSRVLGPVYLVGGDLSVNGEVEGDLSAIGGRLRVGPEAVVHGDLRVGGAALDLSPQAEVRGQTLTGPASGMGPDDLFPRRSWQAELAWVLPQAALLAGLAYVLGRNFPRAVDRVAAAATGHPLVSASLGLLGGVVGLALLVVMAFTLILIPVTLLGLLVGFLAIGFGWAGVGAALGRRLAGWRGWALPGPVTAALGTFVFGLAVNLAALVPLIGDLVALLAIIISLGAVLLTRFGLVEFVPETEYA